MTLGSIWGRCRFALAVYGREDIERGGAIALQRALQGALAAGRRDHPMRSVPRAGDRRLVLRVLRRLGVLCRS